MEKLSSDVPSGSEGTVTYQVAVPDTNEEGDNSTTDVTFTAKMIIIHYLWYFYFLNLVLLDVLGESNPSGEFPNTLNLTYLKIT
jgi:hypothetical protein